MRTISEVFDEVNYILIKDYGVTFIENHKSISYTNHVFISSGVRYLEKEYNLAAKIESLIKDFLKKTEKVKDTDFPNSRDKYEKYFEYKNIRIKLTFSYYFPDDFYNITLSTIINKTLEEQFYNPELGVPIESIQKFDTGAIRSSLKESYSLISPIALKQVANISNRISFNNTHPIICLNEALRQKYFFLEGDKKTDRFAYSALCIMNAIKNKDQKKWVNNIILNDVAEEVRYDLLPFEGLKVLAERHTLGNTNYGMYNWEKGMDILSLQDHSIKHILKYMSGDRSDDHLAGALWGDLASIHSWIMWPKLNLLLRSEGCKLNQEIEDYLTEFWRKKDENKS